MADWNKKFLPNRRLPVLVAKNDAATRWGVVVRPRSLAKGEPVIPSIISLASALSKIMSMNSEILSAAGRPYAEELNRARIGQRRRRRPASLCDNHVTEATEAEEHHRPCGRFGDSAAHDNESGGRADSVRET